MIESMIFFPEKEFYEKPQDFGFAFEEVRVKTSGGHPEELFGWYLTCAESPALKPVLLFFHGNAGNISNRLYKVKGWIERGFNVFLIDYRGYGKSTGCIKHQNDVIEDARAAFSWLESKGVAVSRIVLYGESLGTYPALKLGAEKAVAAVILEAPFTSLYEVARTHYPFVMPGMMDHFLFSNIETVAALKAPLFILHGTEDEICPYAMAGELFEKAPEPKGFLTIPGGQHNNLPLAAGEDFYLKPLEFILHNAFRAAS